MPASCSRAFCGCSRPTSDSIRGDPSSFQSRLPANKYFTKVGAASGFAQLDVSPIPALLFDRVFQSIQQIPGVESAAGINAPPLNGADMQVTFTIDGQPPAEQNGADKDALGATYHSVTPNFFDTARRNTARSDGGA